MPGAPNPIVHHQQLGNGRHALETVTHFPLSVEEVFPFFCDVQNLELITPPELAFRMLTPGTVAIGPDTLVDDRLGRRRYYFCAPVQEGVNRCML